MSIGDNWNGWKVEKFIGEGSFGKVYCIVREEFGHRYESALKVIHIPQNASEYETIKNEGMSDDSVTAYFKSMVEEIVEEFALMSKLKGNTNIVSYEDHAVVPMKDRFGWEIFIRMELLTPLYKYLKENKLSIRQVIQLGIDMCQALEVCQKYNIIHRDIKPENIFVSDLGKFKLGDFGIAKQLDKTLSGLSKKGTYTYMAPEVYKGMSYNSTVDIYSLGIVLYRFLNNNRTPFLPPYPQTIKYSDKEKANVLRMSGKPIPNPCNASGRLAEIVLKACAYNPEDRYDSAVDFKNALQSILYGESEANIIYPNGDILPNNESGTSKTEDVKEAEKIKENKGEGTLYLFQSEAEKAKRVAEEKARKEAEERARKIAEEKARKEAEERAQREAEEKARREAEARAKREAEERARREAEEKARREAEEQARREAAERARLETLERARREEEERLRREAEERAKREAEEKARRKAEEKARLEAERKAKREAAAKAREEARLQAIAERAKREAERKARKEAEAKIRREAEEKARIEAEKKARIEAEKRAKREAEEKARREAEAKAKREAEERAKKEAEERRKREAERKAKLEAERKAKREAEEKAKLEERRKAERARREKLEKAKKAKEEARKKAAHEKARIAEEKKKQRIAKEKARDEARKKAQEKKSLAAEKKKTETSSQKGKKSKTVPIVVISAIIIVGVIIAVIAFSNSVKATMPSITSLSIAKAEKILSENGLSLKITDKQFSDKVTKDCIISQSVKNGATVEKGAEVKAVLSLGKAVKIPDLRGLSKSNAESQINKIKLSLKVESEKYSDTVKKNHIISQNPKNDTTVAEGEAVSVVVSKGVEQIKVPNVVGKSSAKAKSMLTKSGLSYKINREYSSSVKKGNIIHQSKKAGSKVDKHSTLTITISKGKKLVPKTTTPPTTPSYNSYSSSSTYTPPRSSTVSRSTSSKSNWNYNEDNWDDGLD